MKMGDLVQIEVAAAEPVRSPRVAGRGVEMHALLGQLTPEDLKSVSDAVQDFCTPVRTKPGTFELQLIDAAQAVELSNGIKGHIWNSGASKRVLLVHGWGGRGTQLASFIQPLLDKGFSVMTIDCWGHGESPGLSSHGVRFAESIERAAQEFGPIDYAIGHSLGSAALLIVANRSVKFEKLVLMSPPAILNVMHRFSKSKGLSDTLAEAFVQYCEQDAGATRELVDMRYLAPNIDIPILLFHDEDDREIPIEETEEFLGKGSNVDFERTKGYGHLRIIRSRAVVAKAVEYLAE